MTPLVDWAVKLQHKQTKALRLPRMGKRELILVLFGRLFDLRMYGFLFPLPLGVWEGLRFVIVALPDFFSYLFVFTL